MRLALSIFLVIVCAGTELRANEFSTYAHAEQYADIGRVFISPAERLELDRLRKLDPAQDPGSNGQARISSVPASQAEDKARAGGYIVPSNGLPYTWSDGDFRRADDADIDIERLPGAVTIIRHHAKENPESTTEKEADTAPDSATDSASENGNDGTG